jgi:phage N-6-adenine-methyltransferase
MTEQLNDDLWETPPELFSVLDSEFHFTLDVCCMEETAKCARYFTPRENGLAQCWDGEVAFMNPPYSQVGIWIRKAWCESLLGATVVALIPSRTDNEYWHTYILPDSRVGISDSLRRVHNASEIRMIRGRVPFLHYGKRYGSPKMPSVLVVFAGRYVGVPTVVSMGRIEYGGERCCLPKRKAAIVPRILL